MPHIDEGRLHEWLDRSRSGMTRAEAAEVAHHLEACADCRAKAAEAASLRDRAGDILAAAGPLSVTPPPFEKLQARAGTDTTGSGFGRRNLVAIAWAASIIAAVGIGWLSRELVRPDQVALESASIRPEMEAATSTLDSATPGSPTPPPSAQTVPDQGATTASPELPEETNPVPAADQAPEPALPAVVPDEVPRPPTADAVVPAVPRVAAADAAPPLPDGPLLVHGQVTDDDGEPVAGIVVEAVEARTAALTDDQGNYSLTVPPGTDVSARELTLAASGTGFSPDRITLDGPDTDSVAADFRLESMTLALDAPGTNEDTSGTDTTQAETAQVDTPLDAQTDTSQTERFAPIAAIPPPPVADAVARRRLVVPAAPDAWLSTSREDAERRFGRPLLTIADLPISRVEIREDGSGVAVRVIHVQDAAELSLTQTRTAEPVVDPTAPPEGARRLTEQRGDLHLGLTGPLPADSLAALLQRVR